MYIEIVPFYGDIRCVRGVFPRCVAGEWLEILELTSRFHGLGHATKLWLLRRALFHVLAKRPTEVGFLLQKALTFGTRWLGCFWWCFFLAGKTTWIFPGGNVATKHQKKPCWFRTRDLNWWFLFQSLLSEVCWFWLADVTAWLWRSKTQWNDTTIHKILWLLQQWYLSCSWWEDFSGCFGFQKKERPVCLSAGFGQILVWKDGLSLPVCTTHLPSFRED